jgi:hypothetical protein
MLRKLTVVTYADQEAEYLYHIEVDQSVVDAGYDAIAAELPMGKYEWPIAVFDGHITCILTAPTDTPRLSSNGIPWVELRPNG